MRTKTHPIVVGYDGTDAADEAARWAARTAHLRGEPLEALIVVEPLDAPRAQGWPSSWWDDIQRRARETLDASGAEDATVERHFGALVPTLLEAAKDGSMLVLGSRGHGRIAETMIGSASQRTARHARGPVVVVRAAAAHATNRIVVGADDSEPSRRALDFAGAQAAATGEHIVLLRAWKPLGMPIDKSGDAPASVSSRLLEEEEALAKSVAEARGRYPDLEIEGRFVAETPGQALVDASGTAALVVVGSRGHGVVAETLLGSVSHHVLHKAHCPVAVIH